MPDLIKTVKEFEALRNKGYLVLDFRDPEVFAQGHIPGSINLYYKEFARLAPLFLFKDQSFIIIHGDEPDHIQDLNKYPFIAGFFKDGFNKWMKDKYPFDMVISISPEELWLEQKHGKIIVYDLRSKADYDKNSVGNAFHLDIKTIIKDHEVLTEQTNICFYCKDGALSMSMISYLKTKNIHNIYHLSGGFKAMEKYRDLTDE
jgi:hydroxyacylglutathione hydrolase